MATKITQADVESAAEYAVDRNQPGGSSVRGDSGDQAQWAALRSKSSRMFLSNPDARAYLYVLASNSASADMRILHALLCEAMVIAESLVSIPNQSEEQSSKTETRKNDLRKKVSETRGREITPSELDSLKRVAATYIEDVATASTRKRKLERGNRSFKVLAEILAETLKRASGVGIKLGTLASASVSLDRTLGPGARSTILPGLASTLRNPDLTVEQEVMRIASAVGAYEAFSNKVSTLHVVHTAASVPVPSSVLLEDTLIRFVDPTGKQISPAALGLSVGMVARSGQFSASITEVTSDGIVLDTMPTAVPSLIVQTPSQASLESFIKGTIRTFPIRTLKAHRSVIPSLSHRQMTRPQAAKLVSKLAEAASVLAPLTDEASRSCAVLNLEVPESGTFLSEVRQFDLPVGNAAKSAVRQVLEGLREQGLDVAETRLLRADLSVLSQEDVYSCRSATAVSDQIGQLMTTVSPKLEI